MTTNNRSWLSTSSNGSLSRDQEDDCQSLDSFSKDQQLHDNSINSGTSNGSGLYRPRSKSDRYNHYKGAPARVKPWLRDKAITGSATPSKGRFGGSGRVSVGISPMRLLGESVGNNSCGNSVSSQCSSVEASALPLQNEVRTAIPTSSRSMQPYDDESIATVPDDARQESLTLAGSFVDDVPEMAETPVAKNATHDEAATVDTEAGSTAKSESSVQVPEPKMDAAEENKNHQISPLTEPSLQPETSEKVLTEDEQFPAEDEKSEKEHPDFERTKSPNTIEKTDGPAIIDDEGQTLSVEEQIFAVDVTRPISIRSMSSVNDKSVDDDKFYDVLPFIQPSAYNPMSATVPKGTMDHPRSVATYAKIERPTTLVKAQAALLNHAIAEDSEEETDFGGDVSDDESNVQNYSADTLQGMKALDETFLSTDEGEFDLSRVEADKGMIANMWPRCLDPAELPETLFPADWEQLQTLAAGDTQTWITRQLQQKLQGIDYKASAYSEFAAALSDCPPLTFAFLATSDFNCFCFCPCSVVTGAWRAEKLADAGQFLFENVEKCSNQQFTPDGFVKHCDSVARGSAIDPENRFLHGIVYKYLESLFGPCHAALSPRASDLPKERIEQGNFAESASTPTEVIEDSNLRKEIDQLCEANMGLLEKLRLADYQREQLEAKNIEVLSTSAEHEEEVKRLRESLGALEASKEELLHKLNVADLTTYEFAAKSIEAAAAAAEHDDQMKRLHAGMEALKDLNKELQDKLRLAEEKSVQEVKRMEESDSVEQLTKELELLREEMKILGSEKSDLWQELESAQALTNELEAKNAETAAIVEEQSAELDRFGDEVKLLEENNAKLTEKLRLVEEKHAAAVASSEAQAEMMTGLCNEIKQLEEAKNEVKQKLEEAEEKAKTTEAKLVAATTANIDATAKVKKLNEDKFAMEEANATMLKNLTAAENREKTQASREQNVTLVHVGDMPVDLRRFHVQCQKYFNKLRENQIKSHCVQDKSPVKFSVLYEPKERNSIDIQKLLDKGAAVESQDPTYLFRPLDTFNKGHFHTHKLLLPWHISTTTGGFVSRSEFFVQVWQQLGGLNIIVGEKKIKVPLFQESLGSLIPMPNAVLEGMLRVSPAELTRLFAAKIAPYYRAIGRLMVQCVGATADDSAEYNLKIVGSVLPPILRQKLFRGVDPVDESYPLEQLLDHAFSLLGMTDMTRDKAFEYFSIEAKDYSDTNSAVKRIRQEVQEMWIKERSLALHALEEGLTLNGLADMSFCCGLVPLEAVNEMIFTR